jgi:T5SS/PEP-CTERM-associated repeat protein/autotransporter-associated beta strand protein
MNFPRPALPLVFLGFLSTASGQSVWDGGAGTSLWSDANNWSSNSLPTSASAVQFTGSSPYSISLDGDRAVASLLFSGNSAYTLFGNTLTVSGDIATSSPASGSLTHAISSALALAAPTINLAASTTLTLSGAISASGAVTKIGPGTLVLANDATFSSGTTVSAGTLQIGAGGTGGTLTGDIVNNGIVSFNLNRGSTYDYTGSISGTGALEQNSSNTVRLGGTNTFTGGITINSSVLTIGTAGTTGSITCDVVNNSILIFNRTTDYSYSGAITGTGTIYKVNSNTLTLGGTNTFSGGANLEGGTLAFSALSNLGTGGTLRLSGGTLQWASGNTGDISSGRTVSIDAGGATFDLGSNNVTLASAIGNSGTGALTKTGTGTLTLTGTNTYSGGTTVSAGTLKFSSLANLGTGGITLDGGTLQWASGNTADITARSVTIGAGGGTFNLSGTTTLAGTIGGTGQLTRTGSTNLTISGTNTYSGGTVLSNGVTTFFSLSNLGTGGITFNGGTLSWATGNTVDITARAIAINSGGGRWDSNGNDITIAGSFTSANTLTKIGNGTITLSGGTITVGNFVTSGPFAIKNGATFTSTGQALTPTISGTTLTVDGTGTTWNTGNNLYLGSGATITATGGASIVSTGTSTISKDSGTATLTVNGTNTSWSLGQLQLGFGQSSGSTTTGNLSISSGGTVTSTSALLGIAAKGVGNVTVDGANSSWTNSGNIQFGNNSGTGTLTIQNGGAVTTSTVSGTGTLTLDNGTFGLTSTDTLESTIPITINSGGGTLDVASGKTGTVAGVISGTGGLTKTGAGTLQFSATNTFTGNTTISAGTLLISDSSLIATTPTIYVEPGGTLRYNSATALTGVIQNDGGTISGTGILTSSVLNGFGAIDPGDNVGILTAAATDGSDGLAYNFEFTLANGLPHWNTPTSSGNDVLHLTDATPFRSTLKSTNPVNIYLDVSSVSYGDVFTGGFYTDDGTDFSAKISGADFNFYLADPSGPVTYNGVSYSSYGALGFSVSTTTQSANFNSGSTDGNVMQLTAVPEPSALGLLIFSSLLPGLFLRRSRPSAR